MVAIIAKEAERRGIPVIQEVFADRGYTDEGTLVPRTESGAFIKDPQEALERVLMMVTEGKVVTNTGNTIDIVADSVCVHGDNPEAIASQITSVKALQKRALQWLIFKTVNSKTAI